MSLHQDIKRQMIEAMKAKDSLRLNVVRGLLASFTNEAISKKRKSDEEFTDEESLVIVGKAIKQRKDSIEQFSKGGREDLVVVEKLELKILETYLPAQMSREEVFEYVKQKFVAQKSFLDKSKTGQFTGVIMKELRGKADGTIIKEIIDTIVHS